MPSHRRVKDVTNDDDIYDDYDDDNYDEGGSEDLNSEDKEQLRLGAIKVREALGPGYDVSDKEIQDALWHYYYDVAKSVTYVKNSHAPPLQPKKQKAESRFDQAANAAAQSQKPKEKDTHFPINLEKCTGFTLCAQDFFKDISWLNIPESRRGNIISIPIHPRGGLLGGSSKPSKLAALAAARRKKDEEKKPVADASPPKAKSVALLDRLGKKPKTDAESSLSQDGLNNSFPNRTYPIRRKREQDEEKPIESPTVVEEKGEQVKRPQVQDLRAAPSAFARAMFEDRRTRTVSAYTEGSMLMCPVLSVAGSDIDAFAGPSPDDVVSNAQAKGAKPSKPDSKSADVEESVAALKLEGAPRIKRKNIDVLKEYQNSGVKESAAFVVIGHVDHGKSTLMGRLLYDLKIIDQRSLDKLRKEADEIGKSSFALAWIMDQTSEERQHGVTVDIASRSFETAKTRYTILDAPGHQDFVPNMIAGASQADFAVLVADAGPNNFEAGLRGQTKEHALLVRSLGVQKLVVAVNKMDTVAWSEEQFREVQQQMSGFLTSAGFQPKNLAFIPCSGLTGENVVQPVPKDKCPWYSGHTLVEELDASEPAIRALENPFRLTIADVFRGGITNPLSISGRLDAGTVQVGDQILVMPSSETAYIKGIEVDEQPADWAVAGQIASLHLAGIDAEHLRLGDIVCTPSHPVKNLKSFTAKVLAFDHIWPMSVELHRGRLNAPANVSRLIAVLDKGSGEVRKKKPQVVRPGSVARIEVELETAAPFEPSARVILRAGGQTVAAGLIEEAG